MKSRLVAFVSLVLTTQHACGAQPNIDSYATRSQAERPEALAFAREKLEAIRGNKTTPLSERKTRIKRLEAQIADLEDGLHPYYGEAHFHFFDAKVGDIGWIDDEILSFRYADGLRVETVEVVDDKNVVVKWGLTSSVVKNTRPIEKGDPIRWSQRRREKLMWLSGVDTSSFAEREAVHLKGVYAVTGKKPYESASGSQTLLVLELLDLKPHEHEFIHRLEPRTWTAKSGHTTEASFVRYVRGMVTLFKPDGTTKDVRLTDLSNADRKYVRDIIRGIKEENSIGAASH